MPEYIRHDEGTFASLTKQQKEAVGLLSIGTFLEYFDLMLYVHMAVLLNDLFFPKADHHTQAIYSAIAFCSTYVLRPIGALIFGYIGDNMGRKTTVIITTFMMSFSCIIMANLPTYAQIGISATYIISACRIIQGMSSMGEIVGAELYLTEMIKSPIRYAVVALVGVFGTLGMTAALAIASCVTSYGLNWRIAFWFGAGIALIGSIARTNLRETPDFINTKKRIKNLIKITGFNAEKLESHPILQEKVNKKTVLSYFLIECTGPVWFYISYLYCGNILKNTFNFSVEEVIHQNFIVATVEFLSTIIVTYLIKKIYPLKVLKVKLIIFSVFATISSILLGKISNPLELLYFQLFFAIFAPTGFPGFAVFCTKFPVFKRFLCTSFTFAVSRAVMYAIVSFGIVYLVEYFNHNGLLFLIIPILIGYAYGLFYFIRLDKVSENYHQRD